MSSVNAKIRSAVLRHQTYVERLKTGEAQKVTSFVENEVMGDLEKQIVAAGSMTEKRALQRLLLTFESYVDKMPSAAEFLAKSLSKIADYEVSWMISTIKGAVPISISMSQPSPVLLRVAASKKVQDRTINSWFKGIGQSFKERAYKQVKVGVAEGDSTDAIIKRLRGTQENAYRDGVISGTRAQVESVVRTSVNEMTTEARQVTFAENSDIVKEVLYVATLDDRTTIICANLDGKVFPVGSGPRPPQHFNCRSTISPIVKSWKEMGLPFKDTPATVRSSMNGLVPAATTYPDWLKDQSSETQDRVLGPMRADMFRSGKLGLEDFVDDRNRPLSLKELQRLET